MHRAIPWILCGLLTMTVAGGCVAPASPISAPPLPKSAGAVQQAQPAEIPQAEAQQAEVQQVAEIAPEHAEILAKLSNQGPAPELTNEIWLNSEPLQLADLRGQVVIVEFWTYG